MTDMEELMGVDVLTKYCASIIALFSLLHTFVVYKVIKGKNQNLGNEERMFIKWYGICFTVPFLLIQIFQLLGNYRTSFYIFLLDFNNLFYILGFASMLLLWIGLLYLIIIKDGAEIIARYLEAFEGMPVSKTIIKMFCALMSLVGFITLLIGNKFTGGIFSGLERMIE
jgi:hypothetical protein